MRSSRMPDGRLAHRADGDTGIARRSSDGAQRYRRARRCGARLRQPADPQRRDPRRQSSAAAALLVLPLADYHCLRKGGGHCFAISGENQYHAIFDNMPCAIVHPSTAATVWSALDATIELTDAAGTIRRLLLEDFFVPPERDLQRENDLRPQEILTRDLSAEAIAKRAHGPCAAGEKDSFDWPLADVAVALDVERDGTCTRAAIILGAAAPVPHRAKGAEAVLTGKRIDEGVAAEATHAALEGATPLSKNAYKLPLFETLIRRAILKVVA